MRIKSAVKRKAIAIVLLVAVLSFGGYSLVTSSFTNWLVEPFFTQVKTETHTERIGTEENIDSQTDNAITDEKTEDSKTGGDMNDHPPKDGETKTRSSNGTESAIDGNGTPEKHDDSTKTVDTSPAIIFGTIAKFISIIGIFTALTYYIEKFFKRKKKEKQ